MLALSACEESPSPSLPEGAPASGPERSPDAPRDGQEEPAATPPQCRPSEERWDEEIAALVERRCGQCHGETLRYGAPQQLTSYQELLRRAEAGADPFGEIAAEVSRGTMPPLGQPALSEEERSALFAWASCSSDAPITPGGFESDRPILQDPGPPPQGTPTFELRADRFTPPEGKSDHYECFTFRAPLDEARQITRIETIIDDARVLHHVVLIPEGGGRPADTHSPCEDDNPLKLLYAWAPGQGALAFAEGGLRLEPGQELTLQIHYNNSAGWDDVADRSGVRLYHEPPTGPEVMVLTVGPLSFEIPPGSRTPVTGWCELPGDTRLIASFPHMHEAGARFESKVLRQDGAEEPLINLNGWDFASQFLYETPIELSAGDVIETRCTFENRSDELIRSGGRTGDEMCFNFTYITPPLPVSYCNQRERPQAQLYEPGPCANETIVDAVPSRPVTATVSVEPLPTPAGAPLSDGRWGVAAARVFLEELNDSRFEVDLEQSALSFQGAIELSEGVLLVDIMLDARLVISGLSYRQKIPISFSGAWPPGQGSTADREEGAPSEQGIADQRVHDQGLGDLGGDRRAMEPRDGGVGVERDAAPSADQGAALEENGLLSFQSSCGEVDGLVSLRALGDGGGVFSAFITLGPLPLGLELELR